MTALLALTRALPLKTWLILGAVILMGLAAAYCRHQGAADERARQAERALKIERRNATATATAADERLTDQSRITTQERTLTDAVSTYPDTRPSGARVALACQRLRNQRLAEPDLPAECRREGAAEAAAVP